MRAWITFTAMLTWGGVLAALCQALACPAWLAFMLGLAYLMIVSIVLNSTLRARR